MPLAEDIIENSYRFTAYQQDSVSINEQEFTDSLVVSATTLHHPWPVSTLDDLSEETLAPIFELNPDVVLLGTGNQQRFPEAAIMGRFGKMGIGLEVMDNGALCRTFNILIAEQRSVVGAIILR